MYVIFNSETVILNVNIYFIHVFKCNRNTLRKYCLTKILSCVTQNIEISMTGIHIIPMAVLQFKV